MPEFDLYAALNVAYDADSEAIDRAWRAGVRTVHPDRARSGEERAATARTARLNIAREWLIDPSKRARYDLLRRPRLRVEIPEVDPLGSWPARPRRHRPYFLSVLFRGLVVAFVILAFTVMVGIGSSPLTFIAFGLSLITVVFFGLYAVVWVLVGAVYRRFG
jgi:curved DNA-binding protein CbpA